MHLSRLELEKSKEIARSLDADEITNLLTYFEADVTTALNIAGLKALSEIGKAPVIRSAHGDPDEINNQRIKEIIKDELNLYLSSRYLDDMFSGGQYIINIVPQNELPIPTRDTITLHSIPMQLKRYSLPFIGPTEIANHSTYLVASVPLTIEIRKTQDVLEGILATRTIVVSSLLTSRYPLLEGLMEEYHQTINGTFSPLWTFTTTLSNLYSFVRGFKHYRCGKPLNVMDNRHLSLIINSGLLLEQSLVFGSVDPFALVELVRKTKQALTQTASDALVTFNTEMKGEGYEFNTMNLTQGSANVDAGSPINTSIDVCPMVDLSEIAERVLYNVSSMVLIFENEEGECHEEVIEFDQESQISIDDVVLYWANQSFFLVHITKNLVVNATTMQMVHSLIVCMYHDLMATQVCNRSVVYEQWGDPGRDWIDAGCDPWNSSLVVPLSKIVTKPPKGQVVPGCALYEEWYSVSYERLHCWWRLESQVINGTVTQVKVWNNVTDLLVETVVLQSILQHYAQFQTSQDDVVDILYVNETINDQNLEDTLENYLVLSDDSQPEKQALIVTRDNTGCTGMEALVAGSFSDWVVDEACSSLQEILNRTRDITLDPRIDSASFPDPFVLVEMAKNDLLTQYDEHVFEYLNLSSYTAGEEFLSIGKKAVYFAREWYVFFVRNMIETVFSRVSEQLATALDAAIPSYADFTTRDLTQTLDDVSDMIQNQFTIPFGYPMELMRYHDKTVQWTETVRLAVDHVPNYLDPFERTHWGDEELWSLKIRNRCLFGPTGLPILPPTPVTPWLLTINCWVIDVEGEYAKVKILDTTDETIFNPLIGHEPQTYVRELKVITVSNITIGENTRLSFSFTTVALSLVPPWGMMVGDIQQNWFDDHTPGFDEGSEP